MIVHGESYFEENCGRAPQMSVGSLQPMVFTLLLEKNKSNGDDSDDDYDTTSTFNAKLTSSVGRNTCQICRKARMGAHPSPRLEKWNELCGTKNGKQPGVF